MDILVKRDVAKRMIGPSQVESTPGDPFKGLSRVQLTKKLSVKEVFLQLK